MANDTTNTFTYNDSSVDFGKKIKRLRLERNLTQSDLTPGVCGFASVHRWEQGACIPRMEALLRACKVLDITPNELFEVNTDNLIMARRGSEDFELLELFHRLPCKSREFVFYLLRRELEMMAERGDTD